MQGDFSKCAVLDLSKLIRCIVVKSVTENMLLSLLCMRSETEHNTDYNVIYVKSPLFI